METPPHAQADGFILGFSVEFPLNQMIITLLRILPEFCMTELLTVVTDLPPLPLY